MGIRREMGLNTSKYTTSKEAGLGGIFRAGTSLPGRGINLLEGFGNTAQYLMIGGVVIIGGAVLMLGYSFASGKQDLAGTVSAAGELAKQGAKLTPQGRAAAMAGAI